MQINANASKMEFIITLHPTLVEMQLSKNAPLSQDFFFFFSWHQWSAGIEVRKLNNFNELL